MKKTSVVLIIAALFITPAAMTPLAKAESPETPPPSGIADIIYSEAFHSGGKLEKKHDLTGYDHAALYIGNYQMVEADPHMEKWTQSEQNNYPLNAGTLHYKSYRGDWEHGRVEQDNISDIHENYSTFKYGEVWISGQPATSYYRGRAADFVSERAEPQWPVIGDDTCEYNRPFDYKSCWTYHSKQTDGWDDPSEITDSQRCSLKYGYYCSETVWASWDHSASINLDPNGLTVWPQDIYDSTYTHNYNPGSPP